jgi:hypothetical protein
MYEQYRTLCPDEQAISAVDRDVAAQLVKRPDQFVAPLVVVLDAYLDSRLVRTLVNLMVSLVQLRHREAGVLLSELGAMLLSPKPGPAGSKRIERLLHSPRLLRLAHRAVSLAKSTTASGGGLCSVGRRRCSCMMAVKSSNQKVCE